MPRRVTLTVARPLAGPLAVRLSPIATRTDLPPLITGSPRTALPRRAPASATFTPFGAETVSVSPASRALPVLWTTIAVRAALVVSGAASGCALTRTGAFAAAAAVAGAAATAASTIGRLQRTALTSGTPSDGDAVRRKSYPNGAAPDPGERFSLCIQKCIGYVLAS